MQNVTVPKRTRKPLVASESGGRPKIWKAPQDMYCDSAAEGRLWPGGRLRPAGTSAAEGRL